MDINGLSSLSPLITLFFQPLNWDEPLITKMWASNISPKGWMEKNLIWDHFLYLRWWKTAPQTWGPSLAEPQLFKCSPEVLPSFWWLNPKRIALLHNFDRSIPTVPRVFIIFLGEPRFFWVGSIKRENASSTVQCHLLPRNHGIPAPNLHLVGSGESHATNKVLLLSLDLLA